jgi:hypothetical protein
MTESAKQTSSTMAVAKQLISQAYEPLQAQMDRAATLTHLLTATNAALGHLRTSIAFCREKITRNPHDCIICKGNQTACQLSLTNQKDQFDVQLQRCRNQHEADLGKCGKRLNTLKSEHERLLEKVHQFL